MPHLLTPCCLSRTVVFKISGKWQRIVTMLLGLKRKLRDAKLRSDTQARAASICMWHVQHSTAQLSSAEAVDDDAPSNVYVIHVSQSYSHSESHIGCKRRVASGRLKSACLLCMQRAAQKFNLFTRCCCCSPSSFTCSSCCFPLFIVCK